ncbi:hypothetical protein AQUCO_03000324v1 [Aquilegia coerulea]|uniref:Transglycosylase SLT domain-containing protein n=1 Tax=Aquilegia coerulea TaxID=218851 RepID=A0A2G5D2F5_AQUCA|nr:hypothetical protein AQUCO_03000324v1 [Aquilegia coerulea]
MAVSFKYWEDCLDPEDMEAMWMDPEVSNEWIDAGESREKKVHLSRDPDGQVFLTQTEMQAVVGIVVRKHFASQIDQEMIRAIAELESDRQPLATRYDKKAKDTTLGIMQMLPKTAQMLVSEMGYGAFDVEKDPTLLHRPFISVYFGAAYLKWLSNYDGKERNEEFVVRAYRRGPKKATHKSTLDYWQRYISVKQNLPARKMSVPDPSTPRAPVLQDTGDEPSYWDSRVSPENMEDMWNNPNVLKEWTKFGERRGKVRFSHDEEKKPYISRLELRAVSEIIVSKHFNGKGIKPTALCALAEVQSMRFVNGTESCVGISGIDYPKAIWLYNDLGNKAYSIKSVDDLHNPFVSIYFAAAYLVWLSQYEGRERTAQFVVQAYLGRPDNVNLAETGPLWLKFEEALSYYGDLRRRRDQGSCSVM